MSTAVADVPPPPPPTTTPTATLTTSFVEINIIYYYYLFIYHFVDCDVALSRCRHRRSIRAAVTVQPPSRCTLPPCFALPPPPLTLPPPLCRRHAAADVALARCSHRRRRAVVLSPPPLMLPLPLLPRRRQAAADVALLRCRQTRSLRAAATALPPSRSAPPLMLPQPPHRRQATSRCLTAAIASPRILPIFPLGRRATAPYPGRLSPHPGAH
jgi:hypothetical protein